MRSLIGKMILLGCLLFITSSFTQYPNPPQSMRFVNDFAGMLSTAAERDLEKTCAAYERATSIELVVVTVESIGSASPDEYATNLYNKWGVGKATLNNGMFLLIALQERKLVVKPGKGLERYYDGRKLASKIVAANDSGVMYPYMVDRDYNGAVKAAINKLKEQLGDATWNMREAHFLAQQKKQNERNALVQAQKSKQEKEDRIKREQQQKVEKINSLVQRYNTTKRSLPGLLAKAKASNFIGTDVIEEIRDLSKETTTFELTETVLEQESAINFLARKFDGVTYKVETEIRLGEEALREKDRAEMIEKSILGAVVVGVLGLLTFLFVQKRKRKALRESLNNVFHTNFLEPWQKMDVYFQKQIEIPEDYPVWAKSKMQDSAEKGKELCEGLLDAVNALGTLIDTDPAQAEGQMQIENFATMLDHHENVVSRVPGLVTKYKNEAPDVVQNMQDTYAKVENYLNRQIERGFDFENKKNDLVEAKVYVDTIVSDLTSDDVVYRDVWNGANNSIKQVMSIQKIAEEVVATKKYVDDTVVDVQKYVAKVQNESKTTQTVWLELSDAYPESAYVDLTEEYGNIDEKFAEVQQLIQRAIQNSSFTDQEFVTAKTGINNANDTLQWIDLFLDRIRERKADLIAAKKAYALLFASTKNLVEKLAKKSKDTDVEDDTQEAATDVIEKFNALRLSYDSADWITLKKDLTDLKTEVQEVYSDVESEITAAKRRRDRASNYSSTTTTYNTSSPFSPISSISRGIGGGIGGGSSPFGGGSTSRGSGGVGGW